MVFCVGNAGNLLWTRGFSAVYKGRLQDGRLLAIECPIDSERQEFLFTGGLEINSCLSHANIVSLIGYCVENTQLILVYNFLHQRTLQDHLYGTRTRQRNPFLIGESSKS
jgi:hypothetical protein